MGDRGLLQIPDQAEAHVNTFLTQCRQWVAHVHAGQFHVGAEHLCFMQVELSGVKSSEIIEHSCDKLNGIIGAQK